MKTFLKPFEEMPQIEELREHLKKDKRIYEVSADLDYSKDLPLPADLPIFPALLHAKPDCSHPVCRDF